MIRRLLLSVCMSALALAGCVTTTNSPFKNDNVSLKQAAEDNVNLGIAYLKQGNRDAAMQKIQKAINEDPDNADAYAAEALIYSADQETDKAKDAFRTAMRKAPDDPEIQNNYAVFLCQNGKPAEAIPYFLKSAVDPHYSTPGSAYTNAGLCAQHVPDPAAAEEYFRKALTMNPNLAEPMAQLAQISYSQKKYLSARAFIERFGELVPQSRPDVLLLGVNNERVLGNQQGAADYAKQLLKNFPGSPQAGQLDQTVPHG